MIDMIPTNPTPSNEKNKSGNGDALLRMTAEITAAYVSKNSLPTTEIPDVIKAVHDSLTALQGEAADRQRPEPAVPINRSITPDYIICLEDAKKLKMLKRHLRTAYGMTPEDYRQRWGLPPDYPMVAPNYAEKRSYYARKFGLGSSRSGRRAETDTGRQKTRASLRSKEQKG